MSAQSIIVVDVPMPLPTWFSIDWMVAADKWVAIYPERTLEMWCNLPHEWRCEWASAECAQRRSRGVPDPVEPMPDWALKPIAGICVDDGTRVHPSGQPGIAVVPIADPGPGKHDTHEWDHESQTAKATASVLDGTDLHFRNGVLCVDMWYPRNADGPLRTPDHPCAIEVGLIDVRAADSILVEYDFARDGYVVKQASKFEFEVDDKVCDPDWQEVAFVQAWGRETEKTPEEEAT